ncbi:methylthioribulose 1-phosphate dehydratase [Pseudofulvimonas gallinarii]|jgi:methylthioribulose-1-phosphate dehydratase|uniref:Methylthioribulose-1-phosphate dehydratase n=1 Tax=Pseudofulvimonas gallinarii TaxID=634155 RepID=A0A4S3KVZ0_9GAMM|nr:methylthioribulose 1-phosphate dehydratase [Pseudofulvimonas gallinarii]TCS97577.1 methylthioribulose-1-phosphate dehydratase [Pseudofulvimonas gallinarii]THD13443.1 methylthioribulose-1-phosphate dehydratase [Pseudofulvimonas gallinarii]
MPSFDQAALEAAADAIAAAGRWLAQRDWTPATSSNFSARLDDAHAAITVSGRDKGALGRGDIMVVDFDGLAVGTDRKSSAETLLHTHLYRRDPGIGCVLHTHSRVQTIASRLYAADGHVRLEGYELLKALAGNATHEMAVDLPVFPNTQHMPDLVTQVDAWLDTGVPAWGYLIDGHGLYAWGRDVGETLRHIEAFEFLLDCELQLRRLRT